MTEIGYAHAPVTEVIIGAFYRVYNELGYGFLEKVYENALAIALTEAGLTVIQQAPFKFSSPAALSAGMMLICWLMTSLSLNSKLPPPSCLSMRLNCLTI